MPVSLYAAQVFWLSCFCFRRLLCLFLCLPIFKLALTFLAFKERHYRGIKGADDCFYLVLWNTRAWSVFTTFIVSQP